MTNILTSQAAVLLAANIAFMAIPSLLPEDGKLNSIATANVVSIILSLSSVIFGQILIKKLEALEEEPTGVIVCPVILIYPSLP